jgi:two-component sensor histidine kinase
MAPYLASSLDQVVLRGEDVTLRPRATLTLAMVFHELTTNAAKYGALSVPTGRIHVEWDLRAASGQPPHLHVEWWEEGGPPVMPPARRGFGSKFIKGSIASELGGRAKLEFATPGLHCRIDIPLTAIEVAAHARATQSRPSGPEQGRAPAA